MCISGLQVKTVRNMWDPRRNPYITRERLHSSKMGLTFYPDRPDFIWFTESPKKIRTIDHKLNIISELNVISAIQWKGKIVLAST